MAKNGAINELIIEMLNEIMNFSRKKEKLHLMLEFLLHFYFTFIAV